MEPNLIFMGTPEFAVPSLRILASRFDRDHLLVVTQPDRAAGRGRKLQAPPVKIAADALDVDTMQVATLKDPAVRERLEAFAPDLIVVVAFGLILPRWVLNLPGQGCVNLHASALPRFRGASPVAAAIEMGDARTAVSLMAMQRGLDTGPVYAMDHIGIHDNDTTASLTGSLADVAANLLDRHLEPLLDGTLPAAPQSGEIIETGKIVKAHGLIDWHLPAEEIERHVRAMWPWPRAWTLGPDDVRVQIHVADALPDVAALSTPGTVAGRVIADDTGILVNTGKGLLRLRTVQLPGKTAQPARQPGQRPVFGIGDSFGVPAGYTEPPPWIIPADEA